MAILAVVPLVLFILEVVRGNNPLLICLGTAVWIIFLAEFFVRLLIAPDR